MGKTLEPEGMTEQSTMPAKAEEVDQMPSLAIEVYKMDVTAKQIRQYFAPADATSADIGFFLAMAKSLNLNPWKREIHMIPFSGQHGSRRYAAVVGYEVYLQRAENSGKLDGWETEFDDEENPTKCTITIHRKDHTHPFKHTTYIDEVVRTKKDGTPMSTWAKQPRFMFKKCTIAQGFRLCFAECRHLPYSPEEQAIVDADESQYQDVAALEVESAMDVEPDEAKLDIDDWRRKYFASLPDDMAQNDELRHAWQKQTVGKESTKDWEATDFFAAIKALERYENPSSSSSDNDPPKTLTDYVSELATEWDVDPVELGKFIDDTNTPDSAYLLVKAAVEGNGMAKEELKKDFHAHLDRVADEDAEKNGNGNPQKRTEKQMQQIEELAKAMGYKGVGNQQFLNRCSTILHGNKHLHELTIEEADNLIEGLDDYLPPEDKEGLF